MNIFLCCEIRVCILWQIYKYDFFYLCLFTSFIQAFCFLSNFLRNFNCPVDCGDPAPVNGQAASPDGTTLNAVVLVSCNDGYTLVGDSLLTCLSTAEWSESPLCIRGLSGILITVQRCANSLHINEEESRSVTI